MNICHILVIVFPLSYSFKSFFYPWRFRKNIHQCFQASVEAAEDYTKRKFVFRLHTSDGSEFLFGADNEEQQQEWVKKIRSKYVFKTFVYVLFI